MAKIVMASNNSHKIKEIETFLRKLCPNDKNGEPFEILSLSDIGYKGELTYEADDVYAVAATNGERGALVITNLSGKELPLDIFADGAKIFECRITTEGECDRRCKIPTSLANESSLTVRFEL